MGLCPRGRCGRERCWGACRRRPTSYRVFNIDRQSSERKISSRSRPICHVTCGAICAARLVNFVSVDARSPGRAEGGMGPLEIIIQWGRGRTISYLKHSGSAQHGTQRSASSRARRPPRPAPAAAPTPHARGRRARRERKPEPTLTTLQHESLRTHVKYASIRVIKKGQPPGMSPGKQSSRPAVKPTRNKRDERRYHQIADVRKLCRLGREAEWR